MASVDSRCLELAEVFVSDESPPLAMDTKSAIQIVAEAIQEAIEDALSKLRGE